MTNTCLHLSVLNKNKIPTTSIYFKHLHICVEHSERALQDGVLAQRASLEGTVKEHLDQFLPCLLYTSPSPRDKRQSRMPSSA